LPLPPEPTKAVPGTFAQGISAVAHGVEHAYVEEAPTKDLQSAVTIC